MNWRLSALPGHSGTTPGSTWRARPPAMALGSGVRLKTVRHDDLELQVLRARYPGAQVMQRTRKSRRRTYTIKESTRQMLVSVTHATSGANVIELEAVKTLSKFGVPVAKLVETFEDRIGRYLVQEFVNGTPLDEVLNLADSDESFRLGETMGKLLQTVHSVPTGDFEGVPSPEGSWWDWIGLLQPGLSLPDGAIATEPEITFVHNDFLPHNVLITPNGTEVAALIDFEWCFLGDPTWDIGYLKWWLDQDDYPHSQQCWSGVQSTYAGSIDSPLGDFYASLRRPEPGTWWRGSMPPPVAWLSQRLH